MGFDGFKDFLGTFHPYFNKILVISVYFGGFVGFIETFTGISFMLWIFFTAAAIFDLGLGVYANVFYLKKPYDSHRMFRGVFKAFVLMVLIFLTNTFKVGIERSVISPEYMKTTSIYIVATIHYSVVLLIGLYVLLGIAENGAKIKIRFCESLVRILNMRINKIEDIDNNLKK